ncbi:hypothetical protein NIES4074_18740 [Cylindrospermum sp. NIES-4074]|nr:hypothetical protein NIES4074_18740 [Cylindrospermum sp. NIES-4074]
MPRSNSVIRRYTPPTCTLEVLAQSSPLSRWMGKTVLKQLSFELRFDDPRLPEERRIPIRGDRDQLEALCDAVSSYVKNFLQQSSESFWVSFSGTQDANKASDQPESKDLSPASPSARILEPVPSPMSGAHIYIESSSYLTHKLFLGSLGNQTSGPVIELTLLQLFDLASALDEYSADVMVLPTLNTDSYSQRIPAWAPIAAVLVLGVGLTPFTWQYANNTKPKQQTATTTSPSAPKVAAAPTPALDFPSPQPILTPPDTFRSLPLPSGNTAPLPNLSEPAAPLAFPNTSVSPNTNFSQRDTLTVPPAENFTKPQPVIPAKVPRTEIAIAPASRTNSKVLNPQIAIPTTIQQNRPEPIPQGAIAIAPRQNLPAPLLAPSTKLPPSLATTSNNSGVQIPPLAYSQQDPQQLGSISPASGVSEEKALIARLRGDSKTPIPTVAANSDTLFDTPQVAEAREYLKKRWQPPSGLTQTLEYSLMLGIDGSVERILPLNQAARQYVDNAGIPDIGKPFVSTNKYGQNVRLRVVLSPDGKVQTFSESP